MLGLSSDHRGPSEAPAFLPPTFVHLSTESEAAGSCLLRMALSLFSMKSQHCLFFMKLPRIRDYLHIP